MFFAEKFENFPSTSENFHRSRHFIDSETWTGEENFREKSPSRAQKCVKLSQNQAQSDNLSDFKPEQWCVVGDNWIIFQSLRPLFAGTFFPLFIDKKIFFSFPSSLVLTHTIRKPPSHTLTSISVAVRRDFQWFNASRYRMKREKKKCCLSEQKRTLCCS